MKFKVVQLRESNDLEGDIMLKILHSNRKKKVTFNGFLSGIPARDYVFQDTPYEEQVKEAAKMIKEADFCLIGAGAGTSTAAGVAYGGRFFAENFKEFIEKYPGPYMKDMYSAGFYSYPTEEAKWGYWSKHALLGGADIPALPLYRQMYELLKDKNYFVLTTNVDEQFRKAGFDKDRIFATQGSYERIQCKRACHFKTYNAVDMFRQMDQARKDCCVPSYMVPKCPVCGGPMEMNLRSDNYFVEDESWYAAEGYFGKFVEEALSEGKKVCLLDLGTGFNTPTIIRFPFEKLIREYHNTVMVRLNLNEAVVQKSQAHREIGINADMAKCIPDILEAMKNERD